jgi:hypothetical protein
LGHALLSQCSEVSGARRATDFLTTYQSLQPLAREVFFDLLVEAFSRHPEEITRAADAYREDRSPTTSAESSRD